MVCWQRARELVVTIYELTLNAKFQKDFGLKDQIRRAAVSIMSSIAEGFGRGGNRELTQFLFIAKGSLAEVRSTLYVARDLNYIDSNEFTSACDAALEIDRILNAFIKSIRPGTKPDLKSLSR